MNTVTLRSRPPLTVLLVALAFAACDGPDSDPAAPDPAGPYEVGLEQDALDSGGTGVLVSSGFIGLELEPAVDDSGAIVPERWANFRVTVGGTEANVRRVGDDRMEFEVPTMPGGTQAIDVTSPYVQASLSARVFGVVASSNVVPCFVPLDELALIPVGDALYFENLCLYFSQTPTGFEQGIGRFFPQAPERPFEWVPSGYAHNRSSRLITVGPSVRSDHFVARIPGPDSLPMDMRVWRAGRDPEPVASLDCLPAGVPAIEPSSPAELDGGTCLLLATQSGMIYRNGEPVIECCRFSDGHFVLSDDGWAVVREGSDLVVFDATGAIAFVDSRDVQDARFAQDGGPLYVAREEMLQVVDRATGDVLAEVQTPGYPRAISIVGDRLWVAMWTGSFEGDPSLGRFDPETLELKRSLTISSAFYLAAGGPSYIWPYHGDSPVLLEDASGTRLLFAGMAADLAGAWSHVIEVE